MSHIVIRLYTEVDQDPWDDGESPALPDSKDLKPYHPGTTLAALQQVFEECLNLAHAKDTAYQGAWKAQGYMGQTARVLSKVARLRALLWHSDDGAPPMPEETVADTLLDLVNIAAFTLTNLRDGNRWGK